MVREFFHRLRLNRNVSPRGSLRKFFPRKIAMALFLARRQSIEWGHPYREEDAIHPTQ
jgi:hypothetical protein